MSQNKQSAIEAAAMAVANHLTVGWDGIHENKTHWHATHGMLEGIYSDENEPFQDDCREAARAAILAYLSALVEDEGQDAPGTVEQSMKAVLKSWKHAGVTCSPDLEASEIAARAVLRTLLTRAQGESS